MSILLNAMYGSKVSMTITFLELPKTLNKIMLLHCQNNKKDEVYKRHVS